MKINLQARKSESCVKHTKPNKTFYVENNNIAKTNNKVETKNKTMVFQKENLTEEVINKHLHNKKDKLKLKQFLRTIQMSASSFIVAMPVSAQIQVKDLPSQSELVEFGQWIIQYASGTIIIGGIAWIAITRVLKFFPNERYKQLALDIAVNTVKGITEALLLPTIIGIIVGLTHLLFGGIPVFNLPL